MEPIIKISDYTYSLPEAKIAKFPLLNRDESKVLIFKEDIISESHFTNLPDLIPESSSIVLNNTKVVAARLIFQKESGAFIEIFCLEPYSPSEYNVAFSIKGKSEWRCVIGNLKRFKDGYIKLYSAGNIEVNKVSLRAKLVKKEDNEAIVLFEWDDNYTFSEVLEICGKIPIPPYLKRESQLSDKERYQTIYALNKGSVAAPTAGLHFTTDLIEKLKIKGISINELSLHVGAGTFIPVKADFIANHKMHSEPFTVSRTFLENLIKILGHKKIISVGTTSARTLESLYYLGVHCIENGTPGVVSQWEPYKMLVNYDLTDSLTALVNWLDNQGLVELSTKTQIIIVPGFKFRIVDILITNFHQPQSTLLLLIAAFIGDNWRKVYDYALNNDFRFLSYGDSCLLFRE